MDLDREEYSHCRSSLRLLLISLEIDASMLAEDGTVQNNDRIVNDEVSKRLFLRSLVLGFLLF